jgi:hypothetical protein
MYSCRECKAGHVHITGAEARNLFSVECLNPKCRAHYCIRLSIEGLVPERKRASTSFLDANALELNTMYD